MKTIRISRKHLSEPMSQRGAALFTALIILVAVTLVSLASLGTSLMELRMSANEEATMQAFEMAQAAIDDVISQGDTNFSVKGGVGDKKCTSNVPNFGTECDATAVVLDSPLQASDHFLAIERESTEVCPPRALGTSCVKAKAVTFSVSSSYDRTLYGQGRADLEQGYMVVIPCENCVPRAGAGDHN